MAQQKYSRPWNVRATERNSENDEEGGGGKTSGDELKLM